MATTEIVGFIAKQAVSVIGKKFGSMVIERWTKHRAELFFNSFIEAISKELSSGIESEDVDVKLEKLLNDEERSEVLFDAYRRVCFSKSKTIGPRIIGFLTGTIISEKRICTDTEDQVFRAAETLSDIEFIEFFKTYKITYQMPKKEKEKTGLF